MLRLADAMAAKDNLPGYKLNNRAMTIHYVQPSKTASLHYQLGTSFFACSYHLQLF